LKIKTTMKNFTKMFLATCIITVFALSLNAQSVGINATGDAPNGSAILDVSSTTKGFLAPRMTTTEILDIANPADGLQAYNTTDGKLYIFVAIAGLWKEISFGAGVLAPPFECGMVLTIYHVASGGVAPVNKTVSYGTVTGIPGEPTKCWITSNLGADHQATALHDGTEESSGWYWQFNRKQGYKMDNDNTTRTPNTTWVTSIDENSDWTVANDPCTRELGSGWRIPTSTEWVNVKNTAWASSTPWNSGLKMHYAGCVGSDGLLYDRGLYGDYWSRSQEDATKGRDMWFNDTGQIWVYSDFKAAGFPLRCLSD
jgi:hypothetical protein